jgi:hypothetical protein
MIGETDVTCGAPAVPILKNFSNGRVQLERSVYARWMLSPRGHRFVLEDWKQPLVECTDGVDEQFIYHPEHPGHSCGLIDMSTSEMNALIDQWNDIVTSVCMLKIEVVKPKPGDDVAGCHQTIRLKKGSKWPPPRELLLPGIRMRKARQRGVDATCNTDTGVMADTSVVVRIKQQQYPIIMLTRERYYRGWMSTDPYRPGNVRGYPVDESPPGYVLQRATVELKTTTGVNKMTQILHLLRHSKRILFPKEEDEEMGTTSSANLTDLNK